MKNLNLLTVVTGVVAFSTSQTKGNFPDTNRILSNLQGIDTAVESLTFAIGNYTGGRPQASTIFTGFTNVHLAHRKTFNDAVKVSNSSISLKNSYKVVNFVRDRLMESETRAINLLRTKKKDLQVAKWAEGIVFSLGALKLDHLRLSRELGQKLAPRTRKLGGKVAMDISKTFQDGIDDFSS
jgi:hypothetical protein